MSKEAYEKIAAGMKDGIAFAGGDASRGKVVSERPMIETMAREMSPIERAARAIETEFKQQAGDHGFFVPRDESDEGVILFDGRIDPTGIVRAVLIAIREPSEGMVRASAREAPQEVWLEDQGEADGEVRAVWKNMIDTALSEGA